MPSEFIRKLREKQALSASAAMVGMAERMQELVEENAHLREQLRLQELVIRRMADQMLLSGAVSGRLIFDVLGRENGQGRQDDQTADQSSDQDPE
jgi:hypothetical protein